MREAGNSDGQKMFSADQLLTENQVKNLITRYAKSISKFQQIPVNDNNLRDFVDLLPNVSSFTLVTFSVVTSASYK